ncbi:ATP-binding protein [Candidatus Bathyarchaeota archaeon]|nr:ATP-binding protein [Candidatus Bathyarchaeota archaeon]
MIVTIMILQFVNRHDEMQALKQLLARGKAAIVLLYGRRRVGKTRLIQEFMKDKRGLYFYVPNAEEKTILAEFSSVVEGEFFKGFRFSDFASFLEYLAEKFESNDVIAVDEFQRLTNVNGAISMLQKYWDERLSKSRCLLILSGSSIGAIRRVALRGDAPLYGRRTLTLKIEPLKYLDLFEWFRNYSPEELVSIYACFGGTPAYLEHVDENLSVEDNIVEKILSKRSPLHDEPEMLLMEEIRMPQRYMDILSAIARGKNTVSEIADVVGLSRENTTTYLKTLEILDLIERVTPVTEREAKRGIYRIRDPFFSFWFGFVRPNRRQLELGLEKNVWQSIKEEFNAHLGLVFEDICAEILTEMAKRNLLPLQVSKIGKWWWKETEIDIVGLRGGKALAVEAKWTELNYQEAKKLISQLNIKAKQIQNVEESILGIIAKKIEDKEKIRNGGFIALDLQDMAKIRSKNRNMHVQPSNA